MDVVDGGRLGKQRHRNSNNFYWICNLSDIVTELFSWSQWRLPYFTFSGYWYILSRVFASYFCIQFHPNCYGSIWDMSVSPFYSIANFRGKNEWRMNLTQQTIPSIHHFEISLNICTIFTYLPAATMKNGELLLLSIPYTSVAIVFYVRKLVCLRYSRFPWFTNKLFGPFNELKTAFPRRDFKFWLGWEADIELNS